MNSSKTKLLLQIFYVLALLPLALHLDEFMQNSQQLKAASWLWPVTWSGPHLNQWTYLFTLLTCMATTAATSLWPTQLLRLTTALVWFICLSVLFSFGKINHSLTGWLVSVILLTLPKTQNSKAFDLTFKTCQAIVLSFYFSAGLWKARSLTLAFDRPESFFDILSYSLLDHVAHGHVEGNLKAPFVLTELGKLPALAGTLYLFAILAQLTAPLWMIFPKQQLLCGLMLMSFHIGTAILLGVGFGDHLFLLAFLFFIFPLTRETSLKG